MNKNKNITLSYNRAQSKKRSNQRVVDPVKGFGDVQNEINSQLAKRNYFKGFISGAVLSGIMLIVATTALPLVSSLGLISLGAMVLIFL